MGKRAAIVGFGQTKGSSSRKDVNGIEMIHEAVSAALADAELGIEDIDAVVIGNMDHFEGINYVDMWSVEGSGGVMKPIIKVTTGGTTGTTVAMCAYYHVASGLFDRVLAIGWEKNSESDTTGAIITAYDPIWERPNMAGAIGGLAVDASRYMHDHGVTERDGARVTVRDRLNALNNPYAHLRQEWMRGKDVATLVDLLVSSEENQVLAYPLRMSDLCPRTDAAAALIFASEDVAETIAPVPAWVLAVANRHNTVYYGDLDWSLNETLEAASRQAFAKVGIREPLKEIDVCELYLPYSYAGLAWIESIGFCGPGEGRRLLWDGVTDMDGEIPMNPSGGVMSSNPIGATGVIRVGEAAIQIMGKAGLRQLNRDVKIAMATGFGGCYWADVLLLGKNKPL
ncbi:MAG: propanoyl-CoA acyltransferase [Deltaproteobacteria bacterium HGW-Deltaproteobacteria-19]|jgi:acetyl-CoA C-acetyltransferase|nr:MAG: propanoyl-CoA acyltransferase [Deltaproteobacteria bacterium HGW-Deltaproteobacteria-19]